MSLFSPLLNSITGQFSGAGGASQILSGAGNNKKLATGSDSVANIHRTLDQAKADANKQRIAAAVSLRIQGIAEGTIQPQEVWEKVAGFLTITGKPFTYSIDDAGQVEVNAQDLNEPAFTNGNNQLEGFRQALNRLDQVRTDVDSVTTKATLRSLLQSAVSRIEDMERHAPPAEAWEQEFQTIKSTGRPALVGLSPNGDLRAIDQLAGNFDYVQDPGKRLKLQAAGRELSNILNGARSATEGWHFEALGNKLEGDDYFLDLNDSNEVVVRRNRDKRGVSSVRPLFQQTGETDLHIIPSFLKASPEDNRIFKQDWERQAAGFIQAKKPFHLEIQGDRIFARATDFAAIRRISLLDSVQGGPAKAGQALLNIIS